MKFFIAIIFILGASKSYSQFTVDYLRAADNYFAKGDYYSAAQYYEKYLGIKTRGKTNIAASYNPYTLQTKGKKTAGTAALSTKEQAVYNIAESYRKLNFPAKAMEAYKEVVTNSSDKFPLAMFHYATTQRALQQYNEAELNFKAFLETYKSEDEYRKSAEREIKNLQFIQKQMAKKDLNLYAVQKLISADNGANYAAAALQNKIFFTSTRKDILDTKAVNINRLYAADYQNGIMGEAIRMNIPQSEAEQIGVADFTSDGNTMYLTKWVAKSGKKNAAIYYSKKENEQWTTPVLVEGLFSEGFNTQQPYLVSGSQLLFASDRAGGFGGMDLYRANINNGVATGIENLGNTINTEGEEQAPYYRSVSNTLVFSTDGRVGMGGMDLFYSKQTGNSYSEPMNFGYPVNSVKDDLYLVSTGNSKNILENVILSSDRDAACCLELYALKKTELAKTINGLVVGCDNKSPIANASVKITDASNNVVTTVTTDADGKYNFILDEFKPLKATASYEGLVDGSVTFNAPEAEEAIVLNNPDICLDKVFPPPPGIEEVLDNIYFPYDEFILIDSSNATLDKLAKNMLAHPEVKIELGGHTDSNGAEDYNNILSQKRAQTCVDYLISKGVDASRMTAKGYGESKPIAPNTNDDGSDNPEGRAKNRRTEFKVIQ